MDIGKKLKRLRKVRGLSQRELAARAGLTNGTVSLIEQNKTSPSVASLKSLLDAIPLSMAEFFATEDITDEPKIFFTADEFVEVAPRSGLADLSLRQLGSPKTHSLQLLDEVYPPNSDTGPELLSHEGEEAGIVIEGQIKINVGDHVKVLGPGDGYIFDSHLPHRFSNPGTVVCRVISACTPPTF